jgi:hypothetical protein
VTGPLWDGVPVEAGVAVAVTAEVPVTVEVGLGEAVGTYWKMSAVPLTVHDTSVHWSGKIK